MIDDYLYHNEPRSSLVFAVSSNNNRLVNLSSLTKRLKNNLIQRDDHSWP